ALIVYLIHRVRHSEQTPARRDAPQALLHLTDYTWPGNVRQLENAVERAIALRGARAILTPADFPLQAPSTSAPAAAPVIFVPDHGLDFDRTVSQFEKSILMQALEKTAGNKKQAADMLGLKRTTLSAKLRTHEAA